ncbi:MAG TPA: transposase [Cellvibrionaceae bacterium]|nr:transposase [Cellvibrionaceae bacterium]HMW46659.1 transposase [Cellvibrionaceae bacterium]HMW71245.1 transposase [Cellvibrionaceae bacterium]HNG60950.1 transposase [Cellvibrionaceae bacterium]
MEYRRVHVDGGTYFFTVTLLERSGNDLLTRHIDLLRQAVAQVKKHYPFKIHAWVVLPDHLHCLLEMPEGDCNYALRWRLIKTLFSRSISADEFRSATRLRRRERGIWQRRFWEHYVRDQWDFDRHLDYIHYNPLKHGYVKRVADWPHSTFHHFVRCGVYDRGWGDEIAP